MHVEFTDNIKSKNDKKVFCLPLDFGFVVRFLFEIDYSSSCLKHCNKRMMLITRKLEKKTQKVDFALTSIQQQIQKKKVIKLMNEPYN